MLTECCGYKFKKDSNVCGWCGKKADQMPSFGNELWKEIDALLCDWDRCSRLATTDLHENIGKVYRLVKKKQEECATKMLEAVEYELMDDELSKGTCTDCKKQDGPCWCGNTLGCSC